MAKSRSTRDISWIEERLGDESSYLLNHECKTINAKKIHAPGPKFVDDILRDSDRSNTVLRNFQMLFNHGRLRGTGYLSILPVDQGIEHSAGASFAPNPDYFDPENLVKLALEGGCSAIASTLGMLGSVSRKYAHKIPFIVKLNHNEFLLIQMNMIKHHSLLLTKHLIWEQLPWEPQSTLVLKRAKDRYKRSHKFLNMRIP